MGIKNSQYAQHLTDQGGSFTRVVPNLDGGGMPDRGATRNANTIRSTWDTGNLREGGRWNFQGKIQANPIGADPRPTGTFTVANNDFSATAVIRIGDFEFVSGVDFIPGALVGNTATNIATMLDLLQGWNATPAGAVVTFQYPHPGRVRFEVQHLAAIVNFTSLVPNSGLLAYGGTQSVPPVLT